MFPFKTEYFICFQIVTWLCSFLKLLYLLLRGNNLGSALPETHLPNGSLACSELGFKGEEMIQKTACSSGSRESRKQRVFRSFPQDHCDFDYVTSLLQLKARLTSRGSHLHFAALQPCHCIWYFTILHNVPSLDAISCLLLTIQNYKAEGQTASVDGYQDA